MWSLDSVVGTRSLLKQFPILASDWSVRAQLSFSLVTVYHQLSQLIQPARIWDMGTSNYMRQIATMLNCSCERSNGIFSWVVVFCKYCFLKSVSVIDLRYWKQTQLAIVRKRSESDRESGTYFLDRIGPGYCCIQKDHGAWKIWKVSSYFWPRLTDSGLPRSSDTWRGLSLVHFVSEHWTLIGRHDTCPVKRESVQVNTQIFLMHCKKSQEFPLDLWYPHHLPEQLGWMSLAITESHQVQSLLAITRSLSPKRCIQVNVVPAPCEPELCWSFPELHSDHSAPWAGSISAHRVWSGGEVETYCLLPVFARHLALHRGVYRWRWARPSSSWAALFYQI